MNIIAQRKSIRQKTVFVGRAIRVALALLSLAICSTSIADETTTKTLRLGHISTAKHAIGRGSIRFAEALQSVSNGAMTITIVPRGALGGISEHWAQLQVGSIDMHVIDLGAISMLKAARQMQVSSVPFLFRNQDHFRAFSRSQLLTDILVDVRESTDIRYLGIVEDAAPRAISTTKTPVRHVADLKGMKVRVPPNPIFVALFEPWGAIATPTPASQIFMSLKSGMVDAIDNSVITLVAGSLHTTIQYHTPINYLRSGIAAWISERTWMGLTSQQQKWMTQAAELAATTSRLDYERDLAAALKALPDLGIELIEPDFDSFRSTAHGVERKFEGTIWPVGLTDQIRALQ